MAVAADMQDNQEIVLENGVKTTSSIPSEISGPSLPTPLPTFAQLFATTAQRYPDNTALISRYQAPDIIPIDFPETLRTASTKPYLSWTHAQLQYAAEVLAAGLQAQGVAKAQPIATFLFNGIEWGLVVRAAAILGCPFVPLNPRGVGNTKEVEHMLKTSGAAVIIASDLDMIAKLDVELPEMMKSMTVRLVCEDIISPTWASFYDLFRDGPLPIGTQQNGVQEKSDSHATHGGDETAVILFTSGTTSLPKGAIYSNTNISASLHSCALALRVTESGRTCCHMPTHHIGGLQMALSFMLCGGSVVFPSSGFDPTASLNAVSQDRCTSFPCVPAMLQAFAAQPNFKGTDLSSLVNVETGATTILLEHLKQVGDVLRCKSVSNAYASTEYAPLTLGFFDTATAKTVTVGTALAGAKIRICAPDSRIPISRGEAGELHVHGLQGIKGYLGGASSSSFYEDEVGSWFITGDQGIMAEDGTISISGRYKDLIIRGGENIAPAAIEAVLDVKLGIVAQVVGVRDEISGEVPIAVIQPKRDQQIDATAIRTAVVGELGTAFVPERIYTLADLKMQDYPRTSSGKVRKVELKALLQEHEDLLSRVDSGPNDSAASSAVATEDKLTQAWRKCIGIDVNKLNPDSKIQDLADSLTLMRLRTLIKREMGVDVSIAELLEAGTIAKQATLLSERQNASADTSLMLDTSRQGPPGVDDIAIALGSLETAADIQKQVTDAISPHGFTWEDDVEDVLPDWDLGYEVFGSVAGTAKVNHRMSLSTKNATIESLRAALVKATKGHSMQRSFELRGVRDGEPTMRVIMKPTDRWFQYSIQEMPAVDHPEDLEQLLYDNTYFSEVEAPYPSFLVRITHIKSTNSAGLIWALQHSAFDGLALFTFLEDLDSLLHNESVTLRPHIPYKLWADMYYLHRSSLAAKRCVNQQLRRLSTLTTHASSIFPPPQSAPTSLVSATQRKTYIAPCLFTPLPHLSALRNTHAIAPFILIKAALALFLARKTHTGTAVFAQNDNGRSWPFVEPWQADLLPDCMDLAGPTLERTVQIISTSADDTVLSYLTRLKGDQDAEAHAVHAPWNLVREGLGEGKAVFDAVAMSTCLNYLPVRTKDGRVVFEAMQYHETKANCETAWLFNCGVEGEGEGTKMWTQILADEDMVSRANAVGWAEEVMKIATWLGDNVNWERGVGEYPGREG